MIYVKLENTQNSVIFRTKVIFSRDFLKTFITQKNKRTANGRLIFPLTKSDLIRKLADENLYMNNNTSALNNNTPVKLNNAPLETHSQSLRILLLLSASAVKPLLNRLSHSGVHRIANC